MNWEVVDKIVSAMLYEGYILYPYRASSTKNRQRFTFGRIYPHAFSQGQGGAEPYTMQTQCLVESEPGADPTIAITVRFLHPMARQVGQLPEPMPEWLPGQPPAFQPVPELRLADRIYQSWEEAVEQQVNVAPLLLNGLAEAPHEFSFTFPARRQLEPIEDEQGQVVGVVARRQETLAGCIKIATEAATAEGSAPRLFKVTCRVLNMTSLEAAVPHNSEDTAVLMRTFASTHTILTVQDGAFISLMDPPQRYQAIAAACQNEGTWPVLVGDESKGERSILLSSPIILYDYPQIAPESAGDLYDSTEIDEILTLRIMTMTDEEKREMSQVDERARQILQRTERLGGEELLRMHGSLRGIRPYSEDEI